jgi:hypothetical protein
LVFYYETIYVNIVGNKNIVNSENVKFCEASVSGYYLMYHGYPEHKMSPLIFIFTNLSDDEKLSFRLDAKMPEFLKLISSNSKDFDRKIKTIINFL